MICSNLITLVIPAQAGIQSHLHAALALGSRLRGNDEVG